MRRHLILSLFVIATMLLPLVIVDTPNNEAMTGESTAIEPEDISMPASGDNWLTGWSYRKQHNISAATGAGQNYTVRFDVNGGDGTDNGNDIFLNWNARSDLADLRFTASDGSTLLSYWNEDPVSGGWTDYFYNKGNQLVSYNGNFPSAYYDIDGDRTYIFINGEGNDPYVMYWDHENQSYSEAFWIGDSPIQNDDHHGAPVGWVDDNGYIHSIFGGHSESTMVHYKSDSPNDPSSFSYVNAVDLPNIATYPSVLYDPVNDVLHVVYRHRETSTDFNIAYKNSTDDGATWSSRYILVDAATGHTSYPEAQVLDFYNPTKLHLSWRDYDSGAGISEDVHYMWLNTTTGGLYNVTDDYQGTTINYNDPDVIALDYGDVNRWVGSIVRAKEYENGNVYIMWCNLTNSDPYPANITLLYWNDTTSTWNDGGVAGEATWSDRGGTDFIIHDATNITLFGNEGFNVSRFTWDGSSWTRAESIYNSTTRQLGVTTVPYYWNGSYPLDLQITFSEFSSGETDCKGYGWGSDGIVGRLTSGYCKSWVRIPDDISSAGYTMYIYYGNPSASDIGNGTETFIAWDDFDSGYNDGDPPKASRGWSIANQGGGDILEVDSAPGGRAGMGLRYTENGGGGSNLHLFNTITKTAGIAVNYDFFWVTRAQQFYVYVYDIGDSAPWAAIVTNAGNSYITKCHDGATYIHYTPQAPDLFTIQWYKIEEQLLNTTDTLGDHNHTVSYIDFQGETGGGGDGYNTIRFSAHGSYTDDFFLDDFFVRKHVAPEPAHAEYGIEEFGFFDYVDQVSDIDSSADVGTHSAFANQQDAPDSVYDTLTEGDVGGIGDEYEDWFTSYTSDIDSYPDVGTESSPANAQDLGGSSYMNLEEANQAGSSQELLAVNAFDSTYVDWTVLGASPYLGAPDTSNIIKIKAAGTHGWFDFPSTTLTGTLAVYAQAYNLQWDGDMTVEFEWTGDATPETSITVTGTIDTWYDMGTITGLDTAAEVNACRVRFVWAAAKNDWLEVDAFRLNVTGTGGADYELDFEYQWTSANYSETYEKVCIYVQTATQGTENLKAWEWTGSAWASLGTLSSDGWNNFTPSYLTSSTYYIKVNDTDQDADSTQNNWNIDSIHLHTWSTATNYRLAIEEQWTDARYDQDAEFLCIYWGTIGSEDLNITVWNSTSSSWDFLFDVSSSNSSSWTNVSVNDWLTSSTFTIQFNDTIISSDSTQNTWQKDSCLLWTYPAPNEAPIIDQAPTVDNPDDTDNLYARLRYYHFEVNVSDANGVNDISHVELTLATNDRVTEFWTVKFNNTSNAFTNVTDITGWIDLDTSNSAYYKSGNDLDLEFWIMIEWAHTDSTDTDIEVYVEDKSELTNDTWYEANYDVETRLDMSVGPALSDGVGTPDRGEFDDTITASGTIVYYGNGVSPPADEIDVWVGSSEYGTNVGPWNMTNYEDSGGTFSGSVYADDAVGQDTFTFKAVEQGDSYTDTSLFYASETDLYITDRLNITIVADETNAENDQQVNFTLTVQYDYDDTTCTSYTIQIARNGSIWFTFENANKTLFNDTNSDSVYSYNATTLGDGVSETTHGLSTINPFLTNTEWVTWAQTGFSVLVYEVIDIYDSITSSIDLSTEVAEVIDIYDSNTPAAAYSLVILEQILLSDSVSTGLIFLITILEIIGLAATASTTLAAKANIFESISIAATANTSVNLTTSISELIDLFESVSTQVTGANQYYVTVYELIDISDSASSVLAGSVIINETIPLFETVSTIMSNVTTINEIIPISDIATAALQSSVTVFESIPLADTIDTVLAASVTVLEQIPIVETVATTVNLSVSINELIELYDSASSVLAGSVTILETIPLADTISTVLAGSVTILETIPLAATANTTMNLSVLVNELIELFESVSTQVTGANQYYVTVYELIDISDSASSVLAGSVTIQETIPLFETITSSMYNLVTVSEILPISESAIAAIQSTVTVLETIPISETIDTVLAAGVTILEQIPISDTVSSSMAVFITISELIQLADIATAEINPATTLIINEIIQIGSDVTISSVIVQEEGFFYELFLSLEMWGYFGPLGLVIGGYIVAEKNKVLGVLWFIVECLFISHYLALVEATPDYWWHIYILLLGGLFTIVYPLFERRRR